MSTFALDGRGDHVWSNIGARLAQGLIHSAAAALAALLLTEGSELRYPALAGLPFLLWPHNGEAVLWRSAGTYPLAALLSLLGVHRIRRAGAGAALGAFLLVVAMLTVQLAAFAGFVVFFLLVGLRPGDRRSSRREVTVLLSAYALGAAASYLVARFHGGMQRVQLETGAAQRGRFLLRTAGRFLASAELYPPLLGTVVVAGHVLIVGALLLVLVRALRSRDLRRAAAPLSVLAALVTPYLPLLPVAHEPPALRELYLAPLALGGAYVALSAPRVPSLLATACRIALLLVVAGYGRIAWSSSGTYKTTFEGDLGALRQVEQQARLLGLTRVSVCHYESPEVPAEGQNPYGIDLQFGGPRLPALAGRVSAESFIRWFSTLSLVEDETVQESCPAACPPGVRHRGFEVRRLDSSDVLYLCPP
jgi:membrane protein implicated in regulation of membrane protease activity